MPKDGVSGLPGTKVDVFLRSNRPLQGGTIALWCRRPGGVKQATRLRQKPNPLHALQTSHDSDETHRAGQPRKSSAFTIAGDGKFECRVIDEDRARIRSNRFRATSSMLADERPFVRITRAARRCRWPRRPRCCR